MVQVCAADPSSHMDVTNVSETALCSQRAQPQVLMMLRSWKWICQSWRYLMAFTPPASEVTWNAIPPADVHDACDCHIISSNILSRPLSLEPGTPRGRATWKRTQWHVVRAGAGVIVHVDDRIGLVLVDRNTVCIAAGDIIVSICAFPAEAPAAVRFLHPLHNWAIVSFDVADLPAEVRLLSLGLL
jgi:hypothetical protein